MSLGDIINSLERGIAEAQAYRIVHGTPIPEGMALGINNLAAKIVLSFGWLLQPEERDLNYTRDIFSRATPVLEGTPYQKNMQGRLEYISQRQTTKIEI